MVVSLNASSSHEDMEGPPSPSVPRALSTLRQTSHLDDRRRIKVACRTIFTPLILNILTSEARFMLVNDSFNNFVFNF